MNWIDAQKPSFNSIVVRLKVLAFAPLARVKGRFNSIVVRLKDKAFVKKVEPLPLVSIP